MAMKKGKKRGRSITVDFTGVEAGGKAVPDGTYEVSVAEVTEEESQDGNEYLKWKFRITDGPCKGALIFDNTSLQPQALWRLKGLLETLGVDVPDSSMDLDLGEYIDMTLTLQVTNETYQGKDRPKVSGFGGEVTEEEEEEAPPPKSSKKKKAVKEEAEEEEEEEAEEEEEEEEPPKKSAKKKKVSKSDDDDEDEADNFKPGMKVSFKDDDGKTWKGKITAIEDETATVKTADGEEWEIQLEDLTAL